MAKLILRITLLPLLIIGVCSPACGQGMTTRSAGPLDWPEPAVENRPGCYWWWPGSAVDKENITWNLETMRAAGMGGATIVPIYGVKG
ncbi:MAG TPA: hypothetical protein VMY18_04465, partial [Acidobacteriota bacterium]|nr:hypothetical protein [Acidobacteriota bacterium]